MSGLNRHVLVLGVGNLLWADEGFGVRCVERFGELYLESEYLEIVDGGTQGLALLPYVLRSTHLLLFDVVEFGAAPGSLVIARDREVPGYIGADKMSLHQAGMTDVLACAELMGWHPQQLTLIGAQPVNLEDYGGSLTPALRAQLERALAEAASELAGWHVPLLRRPVPGTAAAETTAAMADPIGLERYESGRPAPEAACRTGDARVLARSRRVTA